MNYILLRLKRFCGFITGFVFFIGGILKLMDPVGAGLVMGEYMDFMHLKFLSFAAKPLGVAFALAETVIGTALITGIWRKSIGIAAMAFQGFFTLLTLALVIFNPQMDCGCFGEAINLTHTETFNKNIFLCILICAYYFPENMLGKPLKRKYVSFAIVTTSVVALTVYSWIYIPIMDFTAYKPAAALKAGHAFSDNDDSMYEAIFIYEKDGKEEEFDLDNLPDSTWNFVRTETKATEGHNEDSRIDLSFYDSNGEYHDELASEGKVMVVSIYDTDINANKWDRIQRFTQDAEDTGFRSITLVAGEIPVQLQMQDNVFSADYKTLLSLNRSNGGATYFSSGYLVRKWAYKALPSFEDLTEIEDEDETETIIYHDTKGSLSFQGFLLYVFAVMLLL